MKRMPPCASACWRRPLTIPRHRYALHGTNAVHLGTTDPSGSEQEGWKHTPGVNDDGPAGGPAGGRMDIGPEMMNPPRPTLWLGSYTAEITGPRSATMTSAPCEATGAQLVRRFELAETGSQLLVTQIIRNVSDSTKKYFHWSRSFAHGGGRVMIPLSVRFRRSSRRSSVDFWLIFRWKSHRRTAATRRNTSQVHNQSVNCL